MKQKVSVIIPNFNTASWLPQCLDSCLSQNFLKEIIVVDDGSTDNSWELLKEYTKQYPDIIKKFKNPQKGANAARNFGFEKSSGVYIQWLDSDDFILPGKFEEQIGALEITQMDVAYSDWRMDFYEDNIYKHSEPVKYGPYQDFAEELLKDNWTSPNNYLLRREVALKVSNGIGWNPETRIAQDREYFSMVALLGAKFVYVPGIYAVYNRWSINTISGMNFALRIKLTQILENKLREVILESSFDRIKKRHYLSIISTHKLKACYYNPKVELDYSISPFDLQWDLFHYKMRMIIPFVYALKHTQYFMKKIFS